MADNTRILVMDDEEALLRTLKTIFDLSGFNTETAKDGQAALDLYQKAQDENRPFAAALLDLNVPAGWVGGVAAAAAIKKIDACAKLIASSGDDTDEAMVNYRQYGFCAKAVKPYNIEEIKQILKEVIDGK